MKHTYYKYMLTQFVLRQLFDIFFSYMKPEDHHRLPAIDSFYGDVFPTVYLLYLLLKNIDMCEISKNKHKEN